MLIKIAATAESRKGNAYATDLLGRTLFPKNKEMELVIGHYANVIKVQQTKTYAEDGTTLVDLTTPVELLQITGTWPTKAEAIGAIAEVQLLEAEVAAEVTTQAKGLKLTDAQVEKLSLAW